MDDCSEDKVSKRLSRNLSEKKRRDQFNTMVTELNAMVSPGRKMDKSTVLKTTIALLKKHNEITAKSRVSEIEETWKPTYLSNEEFIYLLLEAIDGFIIIFSTSGEIFYMSESITSLFGHIPDDLVNMTIYEIAHESERSKLYNLLSNPPKQEEQVSFSCYIRKREPDINRCSYELVNFIGNFRPEKNRISNENGYKEFPYENNLRLVFMGIGRIQSPHLIRETALLESSKLEFISRHSLEWKFLFLDHRAPNIIGYLPFELLGTSGYDYYHVDDLDEVIKGHEILMERGEGTSCYYRFLTKGQHWIWLQTRFYITYHQWNSKPEFIVCSHKVLHHLDVMDSQSPLKEDDGNIDDGFSSLPWSCKSSKRSLRKVAVSDCTSMSADSPGSRHSVATQHSMHSIKSADSFVAISAGQGHLSKSVQPSHQTPSNFQDQNIHHLPMHQPQANRPIMPSIQLPHPPLEAGHFLAAIPIPPMIAGFPAPAILTPMMPSPAAQNQMHTDLQRKQAELQASIEQKQAELRHISEQLYMARLGILPATPEPPQPNVTDIK